MRSFSLKSFIAGVAFLALLMAYSLLQYRYWKLEAEVLDLRREGGHLVPSDLGRVNVIQVPTSDPNVLKWRIYAPPGTEFDYGVRVNNIPEEGVPSPEVSSSFTMESVEYGVLCTLEVSEPDDESSYIAFDCGPGVSFSGPRKKPLSEWWDGQSYSWETAGRHEMELFEYDEPLVLHRRRVAEPVGGGTWIAPKSKARGFILWLIPRRKP